MTNKSMLSVERELRGALEQALLAMKRIYQAGYDSITAAGGQCDQPGVMFENDPAVREMRALLDKPALNTDVRTILLEVVPGDGSGFEVYAKSCADVEAMLSRQVQRIEDLELAQQQGEPVAWRNTTTGHVTTSAVVVMDWDDEKEQVQSLYAEQPAPVAVVLPERREPDPCSPYLSDSDIEWNAAIDAVTRLNTPQ